MKSVLIIGLGSFGSQLLDQLSKFDIDVMAVDIDEEKINEAVPLATEAVIGDATNEDFLRTIGIDNYDVCYVCIGDDFESSLETTSLLHDLGAKKIVSLAKKNIQKKFLLRNGADAVVYPNQEVAKLAAVRYTADNVVDYTPIDNTTSVMVLTTPKEWFGKRLDEIHIRRKYQINLLSIKIDGVSNYALSADTIIPENSQVMVLGDYDSIAECFKL